MNGSLLRGLAWVVAISLTGAAQAGPAQAGRLPSAVLDAISNSNRKAAIAKLEVVASHEQDPTSKAWELLYLGELKRLSGETGARTLFEEVAGNYPASGAKNAAVLGMALVDAAGAVASGNTRSTLELIADENVPDTMNADRWLLIAEARKADGSVAGKVNDAAGKATRYAQSDTAVAKRVAKAVAGLTASQPAATTGDGSERSAIEAIRTSLREGDLPTVTQLTTAFQSKFPTSPHAAEAQTAAARASAGKPPDPTRIAVLLPLTGQYAQPAASLRAAIEQASSSLGGAYTVAVYDTAGSAETCVKVLQKAVIEEGATIVIGPLTKEEAAQCAPAAQLLHTAMITLTSSPDVVSAGDQVFRPTPSSEEQVHALLAETFGRRGMRRYAVLHPKTAYGENATHAFADEVTAGGGSVTATIAYEPTTTDFTSVAKQLKGKAFDAIFIPDGYKNVALAAAAVAYQEISVGAFQTPKGPPAVPLLGLGGWNNDDLVRRGGAYVQRGIFVDVFDVHSLDPVVAKFVEGWLGPSPPGMLDAIGYDALLLAAAALGRGGDAAEALTAVELTNGVAGTIGFDEARGARRSWRLLTVTRAGIAPLPAYVPPTELPE
ncbi:MAG: hypothetical protein EXR69_01735 [Myxococcales bacterium]|nr:hypothetical protein [Myxococcales bacterium]